MFRPQRADRPIPLVMSPTVKLLTYGIIYIWDFLIHGFSLVFLCAGRTVKLYFSVPVDLYTVSSVPENPGQKNPGQKPGQKSGQKSGQNFGHADHVLKTGLYVQIIK